MFYFQFRQILNDQFFKRLKCNHGNGTMAVYRDELFVIGGKWANRVEKLNLKQQETDWTEIAPTIHRRCMSASAIWEGEKLKKHKLYANFDEVVAQPHL